MRMMAKIWLFVLLLTLVVGGCRRAPGEAERRLMAIDSLIAAHPDSTLALLAAVDTATLSEPDRAYHALLQTQAMYKAGIPVDDSTLICRAQRYYADHGPADRQIRTMSYRASVADDLGDPELAMRWYKRTELAAREHHDDYNTAYALMSMGVLYQTHYENEAAKQKYLNALPHFKDSSSIDCRMFCMLQLTQIYCENSSDTCIVFADSLAHLASRHNNPFYELCATGVKASHHFYKDEFHKCIDLTTNIIDSAPDLATSKYYYYTSISYAKLGNLDSATHYLSLSPSPSLKIDSILQLKAQSAICELRHDYKLSIILQQQASDMSGDELVRHFDNRFQKAEESVVLQEQLKHGAALASRWLSILAVAIFFAALLAFWLQFRNKRRRRRELKEFKEFNDQLNVKYLAIAAERDSLTQELEKQQLTHRSQQMQLANLETELARHRKQAEEDKKRSLTFMERVQTLDESLADLQKENEALNTQLSCIGGLELEKSALANKLATAQASVNELTTKLKESLADSKVQQEAHFRLIKEVEQMQSKLKSAEQSQAEIVRQLKQRDEQNQLQSMQIAQLHIMLREIFNEYEKAFRKAKNKSKDSFTQQALNSEFMKHIQTYVNQSHHGLVDAMRQDKDITEKEINVICMHLCHIPNAIISQYTDTKEHSVINMKSITARKFFGNKGKCEDFTNY